jgi:hypothetical protein
VKTITDHQYQEYMRLLHKNKWENEHKTETLSKLKVTLREFVDYIATQREKYNG